MRSRQIKRERPTLKTAHDYHKSGSFSIIPELHTVSEEERKAEVEKVTEELYNIVKRHFPRTQNLEYAILKTHLILENALVQYIRCFAAVFVDINDIRFTFSQKLEIAYLLGFGANNPTILPTVEGINKVRNQVAHTFELDRNRLDEILRINHEEYDGFKPKSDRERITALRWISHYICGCVSGMISSAYTISILYGNRQPNNALALIWVMLRFQSSDIPTFFEYCLLHLHTVSNNHI